MKKTFKLLIAAVVIFSCFITEAQTDRKSIIEPIGIEKFSIKFLQKNLKNGIKKTDNAILNKKAVSKLKVSQAYLNWNEINSTWDSSEKIVYYWDQNGEPTHLIVEFNEDGIKGKYNITDLVKLPAGATDND